MYKTFLEVAVTGTTTAKFKCTNYERLIACPAKGFVKAVSCLNILRWYV